MENMFQLENLKKVAKEDEEEKEKKNPHTQKNYFCSKFENENKIQLKSILFIRAKLILLL